SGPSCCSCRSRDFLGRPFRINGLVKIDPQYAGKERDRRRERQEQHDGPDSEFGYPPARKKPKKRGDWRHNKNSQGKTKRHTSEKIAGFPLEFEITNRTALAHLRKSAEDGILKNSANAAARAALLENTSQSGRLCDGSHRQRLLS